MRPISQLRLNKLFFINKISINRLVISYPCGFSHYSFTPGIILLSILCLINAHTSDGQHKEPITNNNIENNGENNNNGANPLPPPPSTLEQMLAMQAQMLQTM
jgi:hypothetical protein